MKKLFLIIVLASAVAAMTGCKKDDGVGKEINPLLGRWNLEYIINGEDKYHVDSFFMCAGHEEWLFIPFVRYVEFDPDSVLIYGERGACCNSEKEITVTKQEYSISRDTIKTEIKTPYETYNISYIFHIDKNNLKINFIENKLFIPRPDYNIAWNDEAHYIRNNK